jgi:hypothetical protein
MAEQAGKEMSRRQRELVDNCFEESLCALPLLLAHDGFLSLVTDELAIALLDDLTSPTVWPYPYAPLSRLMRCGHSTAIPSSHHIRQILYLSLYPVDRFTKESQKTKKSSGNTFVPPSPEAVSAALDLLNSFLITLPTSVILNALPSYDSRIDYRPGLSDHYALATAATAICSAQNCWEFLKPGFLQVLEARRTNRISFPTTSSSSAVPVAENAWPVLEWLTEIFERTSGAHPLLSQIPPTTSGPRFAIGAVMDIIFLGFADPSNHRRITIGERLSNMVLESIYQVPFWTVADHCMQLIDLTRSHSPLISPDRLVRETTSRLHDLPSSEPLMAFISSLRQLDFKLAVCVLYLVHYSPNGHSQGFAGGTSSKVRISGGRTGNSFTSKDASNPQSAAPYPPPQSDRLESALLLPPDIEESIEPQSPTQNSSPSSPLSPVRLRSRRVAIAALKHAMIKLGLIGAASGLGIRISWDEGAFAASASVLENQMFKADDEVAAASALIKDAEWAAACILHVAKT